MIEELPFQDIEALLESIISNRRLARLELPRDVKFVVFSYPKSKDLLLSRYMREKALIDAAHAGLPTLEEAESHVDKVISQEEKDKIKDLEEKIVGQEAVLKVTAIDARKATVRENIERLKDKLRELQIKSQNFLYMSQERKADEESFLYLTWASSYTVTGERFWKTFEDFEDEKRFDFRTALVEEFTKFNIGLPTRSVRFLARHSLWRIRYVAAMKTGQQLFVDGLVDLTPDQLSLLYWSNYYQSIYEMLADDQPSQDIIEDDEKLDAYMDAHLKKREEDRVEEKAEGRGKTGRNQKLNAWDRGSELIITPSHPDYMSLAYSKQRVKAAEGVSEVEVVAPNSRRARNRRTRAKSQADMRGTRS